MKSLAGAQQSAAAREKQIKQIEAQTAKCRQQIEAHKAELAEGQKEEARLDAAAREARDRVAVLRADVQVGALCRHLFIMHAACLFKGERRQLV